MSTCFVSITVTITTPCEGTSALSSVSCDLLFFHRSRTVVLPNCNPTYVQVAVTLALAANSRGGP